MYGVYHFPYISASVDLQGFQAPNVRNVRNVRKIFSLIRANTLAHFLFFICAIYIVCVKTPYIPYITPQSLMA